MARPEGSQARLRTGIGIRRRASAGRSRGPSGQVRRQVRGPRPPRVPGRTLGSEPRRAGDAPAGPGAPSPPRAAQEVGWSRAPDPVPPRLGPRSRSAPPPRAQVSRDPAGPGVGRAPWRQVHPGFAPAAPRVRGDLAAGGAHVRPGAGTPSGRRGRGERPELWAAPAALSESSGPASWLEPGSAEPVVCSREMQRGPGPVGRAGERAGGTARGSVQVAVGKCPEAPRPARGLPYGEPGRASRGSPTLPHLSDLLPGHYGVGTVGVVAGPLRGLAAAQLLLWGHSPGSAAAGVPRGNAGQETPGLVGGEGSQGTPAMRESSGAPGLAPGVWPREPCPQQLFPTHSPGSRQGGLGEPGVPAGLVLRPWSGTFGFGTAPGCCAQ